MKQKLLWGRTQVKSKNIWWFQIWDYHYFDMEQWLSGTSHFLHFSVCLWPLLSPYIIIVCWLHYKSLGDTSEKPSLHTILKHEILNSLCHGWMRHLIALVLNICIFMFSSVQSFSHVWLFATPWIAARQASLSITNSRSSLRLTFIDQWCHSAISSAVIPFSSCPLSLPASESFPMSQLFAWGGQSTGVSASASFTPKKSQGWSPSEWTGWISLQSKGLSRVFSNTTVQKHQFFGAQPSSQFNSHIHTWPLEKP